MKSTLLLCLLLAAAILPVHAAVFITEAAPWSSGNSLVGADWFELTNTGPGTLTISGWTMDDKLELVRLVCRPPRSDQHRRGAVGHFL